MDPGDKSVFYNQKRYLLYVKTAAIFHPKMLKCRHVKPLGPVTQVMTLFDNPWGH